MHTIKDAEPPNELTDEALLNAIAGGTVWAMESLYERYSRILYSLAYRMVADHQVAEDLKKDRKTQSLSRLPVFEQQRKQAILSCCY